MVTLIGFMVLAGAAGLAMGLTLSHRGVTADSALGRYQDRLLWPVAILGGLVILGVFIARFQISYVIPLFIRLYLGTYFNDTILGLGSAIVGFLVGLEFAGRRSHRRMKELAVALALMVIPLALLLHVSLPIRATQLGDPKIQDQVILQTHGATCSPAAIATLARWYGEPEHSEITEAEVLNLTRTDAMGTSTLQELKAFQALGLATSYQERLSFQNLLELDYPALLHVTEIIDGEATAHAVALLITNPRSQTVLLGDPLVGLVELDQEAMESYWTGEAIILVDEEIFKLP